ncbi:DUF4212 domain-containing protein [Actimicrobium antarcticum]|uniref:DUF4212 domain-containing protein n=1 Tax=Actimicrobium antarcticum TaxID=1051899 RepID=A0ABP7TC35_9BURK
MREFLHGAPLKPAAHWRMTRRLTLQLLAGWFGITFTIIYFARQLDGYALFGWPLSFYLAAQGATVLYVVIIAGYAWRMAALDRRFVEENSDGE